MVRRKGFWRKTKNGSNWPSREERKDAVFRADHAIPNVSGFFIGCASLKSSVTVRNCMAESTHPAYSSSVPTEAQACSRQQAPSVPAPPV